MKQFSYSCLRLRAMVTLDSLVDGKTDEECVRSDSECENKPKMSDAVGSWVTYASPRTDAPALIARKGTAPHKSAAHGAEPGFESEWAIYRYPAVAVNRPIAVELRVRRSLIRVSTISSTHHLFGMSHNRVNDHLYAVPLD